MTHTIHLLALVASIVVASPTAATAYGLFSNTAVGNDERSPKVSLVSSFLACTSDFSISSCDCSLSRQLVSTHYHLQIHLPPISKSSPPDHSIHVRLRIVMEYRAAAARRNVVQSNAGGTTITVKLRRHLDSSSRTCRPEVSLHVVSRWVVRRFVGAKSIILLDQWRNWRNPCLEKSSQICIMLKE